MLLGIHNNTAAEYGALFLVTCGAYSAMPVVVCWFAMNMGGHHRRSIGTAWQVGFGNIGGIISTFAFQAKDKPFYVPGYSICIAFACLSIISCTIYFFALKWENKKRDNAPVNPNEISEEAEEVLGDLAPTYRYTY